MVSAVSGQQRNEAVTAADPKLKKSVEEFESMLLADMLKLGTEESQPEGELDQGCQQGYQDLRIQAVAGALAHNGGIGIGRMLLRSLGAEPRH